MTEGLTFEQLKLFHEAIVQPINDQIRQDLAWAKTRRRAMLLERKLVVFAMSGAFVNELSLTYTSNGLAYDVRIT